MVRILSVLREDAERSLFGCVSVEGLIEAVSQVHKSVFKLKSDALGLVTEAQMLELAVTMLIEFTVQANGFARMRLQGRLDDAALHLRLLDVELHLTSVASLDDLNSLVGLCFRIVAHAHVRSETR